MEEAIDLHGEITQLMIEKGWLYPNDVGKQIEFSCCFRISKKATHVTMRI